MTTTDRPTGTYGESHDDDDDGLSPLERQELSPEHFFIEPGEPWPDDVPRNQDITWWRFRDDPKGAAWAERKILAAWTLSGLCALSLMVVYCLGGQPQAEGALLATAMFGIAVGLVIWARDLLPGHEVTAKRNHRGGSHPVDRIGAVASLSRGTEAMGRRPVLLLALGGVGSLFGLALAFPIASLGPRPHRSLYSTGWGRLTRLLDQDGRPIRPGDVEVDGILTVFPMSHVNNDNSDVDPQSAVVLINLGSAPYQVRPGTKGWNVVTPGGNLVAFSKICTHAGCPVSLYEVQTHQLVCPCHQSTFDVLGGCNPVFGPASRSLPQLALTTDSEGYLVSQSDFSEPVGPGFWNRS